MQTTLMQKNLIVGVVVLRRPSHLPVPVQCSFANTRFIAIAWGIVKMRKTLLGNGNKGPVRFLYA